MTPDPTGGDVSNPQSLNRYAYGLNNPTTLIDPLGLDPCESFNPLGCPPDSGCEEWDNGSCSGNPTCDSLSIIVPFGCVNPAPCVVLDFPCGRSGSYPGGPSGAPAPPSAPPAGQPPLAGMGNDMFGGLITCTSSQVTIGGVQYPIGPTTCGLASFGILGLLGATLDRGYGFALGTLGQIFRGRPPGQSFAACVDQNINQTTFGLAANSTKVLATGLGGTVLTAVPSTSTGFSLAEDLLIRATSIVPKASLPSALSAAEFGGQAVAVGGGAAVGLFIGSAANCASQGVTQ